MSIAMSAGRLAIRDNIKTNNPDKICINPNSLSKRKVVMAHAEKNEVKNHIFTASPDDVIFFLI